jgi:hypothetical protein
MKGSMADRLYLHGDYLESSDRNPTSTVYCGFCDGYCLPEHLYNEHEIDQSVVRLNAGKKAFYRNETKQRARRLAGSANYFEGTADPG